MVADFRLGFFSFACFLYLRYGPTAVRRSFDVQNQIDRFADEPMIALGQPCQTSEHFRRAVGVDRGEAAGMPSREGVQHIVGFGSAYFPDDDSVRTIAQRLEHVAAEARLGRCPPPRDVALPYLQL